MQEIEFETDKSYATGSYTSGGTMREPMMVRWLMKIGITDTAMANYILVGVAGIFFGVTIFLYAGALSEPEIDLVAKTQAILIMQNSN